MSIYRDIHRKIRDSAPSQKGGRGPLLRLIKLQEEAGEVAQAVIGHTGANARKGHTHAMTDVAEELADVVITAMVAMHDWTDDPERLLKRKLEGLLVRIKEEGS